MSFIEKIYNNDNLKKDDINEKTTRVRAIIINSKQEVLMCYSNGLSHYEFPGGHLETGETLIEGLIREILEETGMQINKEEIIPFYSIKYYCKNYHKNKKNRLVEIYYFIVNCDFTFNEYNRKLDKNEIDQNYECQYVNVYDLKKVLEENKKTTKENNSALDDMLLVWNEYLDNRSKL